jgi:hypothetical protein
MPIAAHVNQAADPHLVCCHPVDDDMIVDSEPATALAELRGCHAHIGKLGNAAERVHDAAAVDIPLLDAPPSLGERERLA